MIAAIYDRRSIRKFIDKPIPQKDITDIIQSGGIDMKVINANEFVKGMIYHRKRLWSYM